MSQHLNNLRFVPNKDPTDFFIIVAFRCGSIHENDKISGISHFLEHLLFKQGTTERSIKLMNQLGKIGATWNAQTSTDYTLYYIHCKFEDVQIAVKTILSIVQKLDISQRVFDKEKQIILEEMALSNHDHQSVYELIHDGTVYSNSVIGTEESIKALSIQDVAAYHGLMYREPLVVFSCSKSNRKVVEDLLKDIKTGCKVHAPILNINQGRSLTRQCHVFLKMKPDELQTCKLAYLAFPANDPRSRMVTFFAFVLHSRMFIEAREIHNLVYNISIKNNTGAHTGCLIISFSTKDGNVIDVLKILSREVKYISKLGEKENREYFDQWMKTREIKMSCNFDACMFAIKEDLFGAPPPAQERLTITQLFDPERIGFYIKTRKADEKAILKTLRIS